jgi:hypothetical protein
VTDNAKPTAKPEQPVSSKVVEKVYHVGSRELFLSFLLFILLFGGVSVGSGFFMGIYSAQYFFTNLDYEGEPNSINTVTKYCNEMGSAYKERDQYATRIMTRQDEELAYIDEFLKGKGAALDPGMKRIARKMAKDFGIGGSQKAKAK